MPMPRPTNERNARDSRNAIEGIPTVLRWIATGLCTLAFLASTALTTLPYFERLFR